MKLKDVVREVRDTHRGDITNVPIVGLEHIIPYELTFDNYLLDAESTFTKVFKKGQVLFGRRRAYQHKAAIAHIDGICSGDIMVLEAIPGKIDPNLLPFVIQNDGFFDYAIQHSEGGLSPRVKWSAIANYEFTLPSLDEQKVLADKLWAAYRVKESYKKLLATTDDMLKAKFIEMFGGLEKNGTIKDIIDTNILSVKKSYSKDSLIEYIDISSIDSTLHNVNGTTTYIVDNAPSRAQQCVQNGDILVSTVRPINRNIAVVNNTENNLVASTGFCVLRPISGYEKYILTIVVSDEFTQSMCDKASGGVYPAVVNSDVLNYPIVLPDKNSLQKISAIATQAEATKESLRKSIENIDQVIKSLINQ